MSVLISGSIIAPRSLLYGARGIYGAFPSRLSFRDVTGCEPGYETRSLPKKGRTEPNTISSSRTKIALNLPRNHLKGKCLVVLRVRAMRPIFHEPSGPNGCAKERGERRVEPPRRLLLLVARSDWLGLPNFKDETAPADPAFWPGGSLPSTVSRTGHLNF
ncbi:hypothetical protein BDW67DRAFT_159154 [Aspergillus spinulosporus]